MDSPKIILRDNTAPFPRYSDSEDPSRVKTNLSGASSSRWTRPSVRNSLRKRKYAKWQPRRLGLADDSDTDRCGPDPQEPTESDTQLQITTEDSRSTQPLFPQQTTESNNVETTDFAPTPPEQAGAGAGSVQGYSSAIAVKNGSTHSELDILYENQRGWFFFGIPLYSHSSLLNLDPSAWVTQDMRYSPVNITDAQPPDPSWVWAWRTWYVDMSGDVDEQGWKYSFSFSSSAWHGTHPWFHSFVRRRRWVRLRTKRVVDRRRRGRTGLEAAHMLNEDYFTIHSAQKTANRASSSEPASRVTSAYFSQVTTHEEEESPFEEICNIPTLLDALKAAVVDREKIDALDRFIEEGGEELYYLEEKVPEIMSTFVFQISRWRFLNHLTRIIDDLSRQIPKSESTVEAEKLQRKHNYLSKASKMMRHHLTGPEVFDPPEGARSSEDLLDLTPRSESNSMLKRHSRSIRFRPMDDGGEIKGIPSAAEVGREGHIYRLTSLLYTIPPPLSPSLSLPSHPAFSCVDGRSPSFSMFARGCPRLGRLDLSAVLDSVAANPEEPLLFLYPRLSSTAWQQRRSISFRTTHSTPTGRPSRSGGLVSRPPPRRSSFGSSKRRWIASDTAIDANAVHSAKSSPQQSPAPTSAGGSGKEIREERDEPDAKNSNTSEKRIPKSANSARRRGGKIETKERQPAFDAFSDFKTAPQPSPNESQNPRKWLLGRERRMLRTSASRNPAPSRRAPFKQLSVQDRRKLQWRLRMNSAQDDRTPTDEWEQWLKYRDVLERQQQESRMWARKATRQKELLVPEETVALLAGVTEMHTEENIWYVPVHNGCKVHVLHPAEGKGRHRKVVLSGSERVVELVGDRIMRAINLQEGGDPLIDIRKPAVPVLPSRYHSSRRNEDLPLVRGVWDFQTATKNPIQLDLLLPMSEGLTTVREFAEHIDELVLSTPPPQTVEDSTKPVPHKQRVRDALLELFLREANQSLYSTAALNRAITHLLEHQYLGAVSTIFLRAEHVATVDTFNIILRALARRQDTRLLSYFMQLMGRMKIQPDSYTWLALFDCLISTKTRSSAFEYMLQKGYLAQPKAMRSALQLTIQDLLTVHLDSGKSVDSFVNTVITNHAGNWMSRSLVSQMLSVFVRRKDHASLDRLLQICVEQGFEINNSATVNQIALMFRSRVFLALQRVYKCITDTPNFKRAWERLFLTAYKNRHYNVCRVLWRYACMDGDITVKMRRSVLVSLVRNVSLKRGEDLATAWNLSAGKVIVGLDLHLPNYPLRDPLLKLVPAEFHENPVSYLMSGYAAVGEDRQRQLAAANMMIQRDITVGPWYQPSKPLGLMLEAAVVLDKRLMSAPRPTAWLLQNAIHVPVELRKDAALP
ncbi:uncharacterized protein BDW47DRAFT_115815 [Aspergillus candidus]|uniref:Peroxin/Ferlin domain-containing protein n=1 Tax=Aspergillus candidus TaxID=41067 RepID=A0A2I2FJQ6_ASPCN|nr:hypothetical protein BDW47DRAFT_115815 [Aspergillus candidus]PLB40868.1 hypothetical protein BDW47DRAFT_115815 [Aspergillus candidus]